MTRRVINLIALFAAVALFAVSCSDDEKKEETHWGLLFQTFEPERVALTINGKQYTPAGKITITEDKTANGQSSDETKKSAVINLVLWAGVNGLTDYNYTQIPVTAVAEGDRIILQGEKLVAPDGLYEANIAVNCVFENLKLNVDARLTLNSNSFIGSSGKAIEFALDVERLYTLYQGYPEKVTWNEKEYYSGDFLEMAMAPAFEMLKEDLGFGVVGLKIKNDATMELYSKENIASEPNVFPGEYVTNEFLQLFGADAVGARYISNVFYGSKDISTEVFPVNYDGTYFMPVKLSRNTSSDAFFTIEAKTIFTPEVFDDYISRLQAMGDADASSALALAKELIGQKNVFVKGYLAD